MGVTNGTCGGVYLVRMDLLDVLVGCATLMGMTSTILVTQHIDLDASAYSVRVRGGRGHE